MPPRLRCQRKSSGEIAFRRGGRLAGMIQEGSDFGVDGGIGFKARPSLVPENLWLVQILGRRLEIRMGPDGFAGARPGLVGDRLP
jgi:hypothetical protein